jgi:hypothetical protein
MTTQNTGEEIVGEYLRHIKHCDFVETNIDTTATQGEIDVIGINLNTNEVYACEVTTHLVTGMRYSRSGKNDNVERIVKKFSKDIEYVHDKFPNYAPHFMLWSPIVKSAGPTAKNNQMNDVDEIVKIIKDEYDIDLEIVINNDYYDCLFELRGYASKETKALGSFMRYLQIEESLKKHLKIK